MVDLFTTLALRFDPKQKSTLGFLAFQIATDESPGFQLLQKLKDAPYLINDPMILMLILSDIWVKVLQGKHVIIYHNLLNIQHGRGLRGPYPRRNEAERNETDINSLHHIILLQHTYLINSITDFVSTLRSLLASILNKIKNHINARQSVGNGYNYFYAKQYVEYLKLQANTEIAHRQRILDRIEVYL